MIRRTIRRQIIGIAVGLIVLMVITSALSMIMAWRVGHLFEELTERYIPAYTHLSRVNVLSLERAVAFRRMVIAKMQTPRDLAGYAARLKAYDEKESQIDQETAQARKLIIAIIEDRSTPSDNAALARLEARIDAVANDFRHNLGNESLLLLPLLDEENFAEVRRGLMRIDTLRDEFNDKIDAIRADMLTQVHASAATVMRDQQQAIVVSAIVTVLAAMLGLVFAMLVSTGITRPVRRLLEGTRAVEAGRLDGAIDVTTRDEIGQLTTAFNRMVEQLRRNEKVRETFGKYIDPQVVEGLLDRPALTASEGQRRVMTVLFCDMKGFTSLSEGMTPQGLVKVMNHYLSTMSGPIRTRNGIIDKYIGDAIMSYWGEPFVVHEDQSRLACLAAIDMIERLPLLRKELPELLGVRSIARDCDLRIGIATGEVLVGSIGSEYMMSYTVMGDTVNLASRLETANKMYGTHILASQATVIAASPDIEAREIDRLVVVGQTVPQAVFEIMGRKGEVAPQYVQLQTLYSEGLAAYRERNWQDASRAFHAALEAVPGDGPSMTLARRVESFLLDPPPEDWDGAWQLDRK